MLNNATIRCVIYIAFAVLLGAASQLVTRIIYGSPYPAEPDDAAFVAQMRAVELAYQTRESGSRIGASSPVMATIKSLIQGGKLEELVELIGQQASKEGLSRRQHFLLGSWIIEYLDLHALKMCALHGLDLKVTDSAGHNLVFAAVALHKKEPVSFLVASGVDVNANSSTAITALDLAISMADSTLALALLESGASPCISRARGQIDLSIRIARYKLDGTLVDEMNGEPIDAAALNKVMTFIEQQLDGCSR